MKALEWEVKILKEGIKTLANNHERVVVFLREHMLASPLVASDPFNEEAICKLADTEYTTMHHSLGCFESVAIKGFLSFWDSNEATPVAFLDCF